MANSYLKIHADVMKNSLESTKQNVTLWTLILALDDLNYLSPFPVENAVTVLKEIHQIYEDSDGSTFRTQSVLSRGRSQMKEISAAQLVHVYGGVEVILRTFFHPAIRGPLNAKVRHSTEAQLRVRTYCVELLHGICLAVDSVARKVGSMDELFEYLFLMMEDRWTFIPASALLEDLLASNRKIVNLRKIANLHSLLTSLRDNSFPGFCRILSVLVADIDFSEERSTLIAKDKEESDRSDEKSLVDENQRLLLSYPELLNRMVKMASRPFPGGSVSPLLRSLQTLGNIANVSFETNSVLGESSGQSSASRAGGSTSSSLSASAASSASSSSSSAPTLNYNTADVLPVPLQVMNEVMFKVEVLYILTLFLSGKFQHEVQTKLGDLKLIPALSDIFDKLGWNNNIDVFPSHNHLESEDCDCTPESALKIQFLRFMHSFCDHNEKKHLLLSNNEVTELKGLCVKYKLERPPGLDAWKSSKLRCRGSRGLLTKIVKVLKKTNPNNSLRFWLSRAVEGFLRGSVSPPDQHFLINRGLVEHLVEHILHKDTEAKEIIQSSFDLLGELMKFNAVGFQRFNEAITSESQFESFVSIMTSNVVDSNMFIRCIVLSLEKFSSSNLPLNLASCRLCSLIKKWENKIYLMYKLITSISVDSLTQENVSCLNTTLIFFMFAFNHGLLGQYLQAFLLEEEGQKHPGLILVNLRELLLFWRAHYLRRGKDCNQLEHSSSISFEHWQRVVDVMLQDDASKDTSIMRYLAPKHRQTTPRLRASDFPSRDG